MDAPVFFEIDADGTVRTDGLDHDGFPRLAWEALSAAGYTTPPTYEVVEWEEMGLPRTRVVVTVAAHPVHLGWADLSLVVYGVRGAETLESAALRLLTDFCDFHPQEVAVTPFGLFPAVDPEHPGWLDRLGHLEDLLWIASPLDTTQVLTRCLNALYTLQSMRLTTGTLLATRLTAATAALYGLDELYEQCRAELLQTQIALQDYIVQTEIERGDHVQQLHAAQVTEANLRAQLAAHDVERLALLQHIADLQLRVEEGEIELDAWQAFFDQQPPPPVVPLGPVEEPPVLSGLDEEQVGPPPAAPAQSEGSVGS